MQDFASKRNALFACLDDASKELKGTALDQVSPDKRRLVDALEGQIMVYRQGSVPTQDKSLSRMRGKESIFKKPELPIGRCLKPRKTPDYQMNPHKWMKYSLSDVDISDHTNTSAAFAFLKEIDEQRDAMESEPAALTTGGDSNSIKIEFKKSSKIKRSLKAIEAQDVPDAEVDKPKLRGSKLLMPEYVIGQKKEKKKKNLKGVERAAGTLALSHLQEDDDEATKED